MHFDRVIPAIMRRREADGLRCCSQWVWFVALLVGCPQWAAAGTFDVRAHYEKHEYLVPMRDGIRLFTAVYRPKRSDQLHPMLMVRTPYSIEPYGAGKFPAVAALAPSEDFLREHYILVLQDARGTHRSEGEWVDFRPAAPLESKQAVDETTDTWDTIDWLLKNVDGNNGRVGQWGISYPGWYAVMGMLRPHPALKAVSPQATTADPFIGDDFHHNGAFIPTAVKWVEAMTIAAEARRNPHQQPQQTVDFGTAWSYDFFLHAGAADKLNEKYYGGRLMAFWSDLIEHPDYDEYWQHRNSPHLLHDIAVPVLNVAGWFDEYDMYGAFATYQAIERMNPGNRSVLVAGPWRHGGWLEDDGSTLGDMRFDARTSQYYQKEIVFPFFQYYLQDKGAWPPAEAIVFETGANRWHRLEQWPPRGVVARNLYFQPNGRLSFAAPIEVGYAAHDSYPSDPARPVPYSTDKSMKEGYRWMVADQRYAFSRPDVLTWQTEVLDQDITIAGPIPVEIFAATSGTDSDWFVKLIDVYPYQPKAATHDTPVEMRGYQMMLGFEVMRGKYRESFSKPSPMRPDEPTRIAFSIWDKYHTFKQGHRIMVQVQSSMFPFFDRNPQTFTNIYRAGAEQYVRTTQRIFRSRQAPSHLVLPILQ